MEQLNKPAEHLGNLQKLKFAASQRGKEATAAVGWRQEVSDEPQMSLR